jgi:hypothetical protein
VPLGLYAPIVGAGLGGSSGRAGRLSIGKYNASAAFVLALVKSGIGLDPEAIKRYAVSRRYSDADRNADAHIPFSN